MKNLNVKKFTEYKWNRKNKILKYFNDNWIFLIDNKK